MAVVTKDESFTIRAYPEETNNVDIVGEEGFVDRVLQEFGMRAMRGTALTYHDVKTNKRHNVEPLYREVVKGKGKALEIGTFRGVSTAVLGHYYDEVVTIDVMRNQEAIMLWRWAGVHEKIRSWIIDTDESKRWAVEDFDFNFAFIDGMHTYDAVKYDFECVKHCGHVVFHDYGISSTFGVKKFVDTLPQSEITVKYPFAIWTARK